MIMEYKRFKDKLIVRIDKGEEIVKTITDICRDLKVTIGHVSGIGAINHAVIGLFDTASKEYHSKEFKGDFEIAPLVGNISTMDNVPYLHLHINICDKQQNSYGGHLNSAVVSATCEIIIDIIDGQIDRRFSDEIGLNLLKVR